MMGFKQLGLLMIIITCLSVIIADAQDSSVYVTTQDYVNLRLGPGENWDVITRLDYGVTLRATGRSVDSQWIQVEYGAVDGFPDATIGDLTYGWIAYWLLIWSGDILDLPIDGVQTVQSARQSGPLISIGPDTLYYIDGIDPSTRVENTVDSPRMVEVTGRLGSATGGFFWIQFEVDGEYYWTGSWEVGVPKGYRNVADGSSVFPYGRLLTQLQQVVSANSGNWATISRRWYDLEAGFQTTCNNIPPTTVVRPSFFTAEDLQTESEFVPAVTALRSLIDNMNNATTLFEEMCARPETQRFATAVEVNQAVQWLRDAERQRTIVNLFLAPLERRNPLLSVDN